MRELRAVNFDVFSSELLLCFLLCKTQLPNIRVSEHDSSYVLIVHLKSWSVVEQSLRKYTTSSDSNWSQSHSFVHNVAQSIDALSCCILVLICQDQTTSVCSFHPGLFESKSRRVWRAANR